MEKRKAHYPLTRIKALIQNGNYRVTATALRCAANDFGFFDAEQVAEFILGLDDSDFFKSMTTHFLIRRSGRMSIAPTFAEHPLTLKFR